MKSFIVNSKDLFDRKKNPGLSLRPQDILKNVKIKKNYLEKRVCREGAKTRKATKKTPEQELLEELADDVYGYDLRNWDKRGITKEAIRERYENTDNDFPVVSASRYFSSVLPTLKEVHNVPVERVIEIIMAARRKNWKQLAEYWLGDLRNGLKWYFQDPNNSDSSYLQRCYDDYVRYCELIGKKPLTKREIYDSVKVRYEKGKKKNGSQ
jgi:phosphoribosyl-ATP pyrophosphohydrolase